MGHLFSCSPEINRHFPLFLKIKILDFLCFLFPKIAFVGNCLPVHLIFRLLFPCFSKINGIVPCSHKPLGPHNMRRSVKKRTFGRALSEDLD